MHKVRHTKIRNSGLLFEFLLRQITSDVLNKITRSKAVSIVKKRFDENTELGKELALYNIIINKKFNNDRKADYFISEVIKERAGLNNTILKREKYNLIKEIQSYYNLQQFLSSKAPNYKVYASTYKLFEYSDSLSPEDRTKSYFNIVEHITTPINVVKLSETTVNLPDDEDLRILTYKTLLEKFNQKYSNLNKPQKNLLKAYINNVSNTNSLKEYIDNQIPHVKNQLKKHSKILKDKVVKIKLAESINSIEQFCDTGKTKNVEDKIVIQMMRFYELVKALKKNEKK